MVNNIDHSLANEGIPSAPDPDDMTNWPEEQMMNKPILLKRQKFLLPPT